MNSARRGRLSVFGMKQQQETHPLLTAAALIHAAISIKPCCHEQKVVLLTAEQKQGANR